MLRHSFLDYALLIMLILTFVVPYLGYTFGGDAAHENPGVIIIFVIGLIVTIILWVIKVILIRKTQTSAQNQQ